MSAFSFATGHQDFRGAQSQTMAWVVLALAGCPLIAWDSSARQAATIGTRAAASLFAALFF